MHINPFLWVSLVILFLLAEVGHPGLFFFLPFACSAAATALISVWVDSIIIQALAFLICTPIAFVLIQLWVRKHRHTPILKHQQTNTDALIGQEAVVITTIEQNGTGYVKVNGLSWLARSNTTQAIEANERVEILGIKGAHLIVQKIKN